MIEVCSLGALSVQVEVNVQDCFSSPSKVEGFSPPEHDPAGNQPPSNPALPISETTWQSWFQCWLDALHPDLSPAQAYELTLRLADDADIQELNAQYRQKDQPTDVLAFAALEVDCPQPEEFSSLPLYLGDIVISVDTAQRQAQQQNHPLQTELAWLAAHGLLHLLGWDHPDEESLMQMLSQQATLLTRVGLRIQID